MQTHRRQSLRKGKLALVLVGILLVALLAACQSEQPQPTATPVSVEEAAAPEEKAAAEPAEPTAAAEQAEEATATPPAEAEAAATPESAEQPAVDLRTFQIVPEGTEARFYIDEILLGQPKTVIGVTSDVTGEVRVDPQNPGAAEIGPVTINARDLTTDSDRRNGAIRRFILQSERDEFQYIVFAPTAIEGMPATVAVGEPFEFQVTGFLTVRDVTNPVTFAMTVTAASETELSGIGTTTVNYPDFALNIPEVPSVTGVQDEVRLEIEFRAVAE